jgi:outer membrane protein TolC
LSTDYTRNGDNNDYSVGVEQTIDLWDRQGARRQKAGFMRTAAQAQYQEVVLNKSADAIDALINWRAARSAAVIAKSQQQQLNSLLELVEIRQAAGDLGSIDAELTFLSLSKQFAQVAGAEAQLQMAEAMVRELLPDWEPERGIIPDDFWPSNATYPSDEELLKHPKVASAYAQWLTQKEEAEVTRRSAKANPTFGINAGQEARENTVGLTFSIPLNIRNNYSAETRAAERMALETEARFRAQYRKLRFDLQGAFGAWQSYNLQFTQWQSLVKGRIESSGDLLEKQWRSGDLSTTNYLIALNQRAESLLSGIELEKQTRIALKNLMLQSGRLIDLPPVQHDFSIE